MTEPTNTPPPNSDLTIDEDRIARGIASRMTVEPHTVSGDGIHVPGMYRVYSASDETYLVDTYERACECPDNEYNEAFCKHLARVSLEHLGIIDPYPLLADDPVTERQADTTTADGGNTLCEDCQQDAPGNLTCFNCYRAGFEEVPAR